MKFRSVVILASVVAVGVPVVSAMAQGKSKPAASAKSRKVARGEYLVRVGGCNDCHTPLKMGQNGPEPDMTRMLSGHPENFQLPPPPQPAAGSPWIASIAATNTAWAGPWGITYPINLTPDKETGLGSGWTEQNFIEALRTGKHMGRGRPILPPMPWQNMAGMTDEDLKAMWAYLQSIPAIRNRVPEPTPPGAAPGGAAPGGAAPGGAAPGGAAPKKP